jgi:hypothetical protein
MLRLNILYGIIFADFLKNLLTDAYGFDTSIFITKFCLNKKEVKNEKVTN